MMQNSNEMNPINNLQPHNNLYTSSKQNKIWMGTWTSSIQPPYMDGASRDGFNNQTVRMIVHPHMEGSNLRIHFSNVFGSYPLTFGEVRVAYSADGCEIYPETDRKVTFEGKSSIVIPIGEKVVSDTVFLDIKKGQDLSVSVFVPEISGPTSWHFWSQQTTYIASGNQTSASSEFSLENKINSWFWIEEIDVQVDPSVKGAIVTLGDSITDAGHCTLNSNRRWPDFLAARFNELPFNQRFSVLNAGISGNEILNWSEDGGVSALERIERDVFSKQGVTDVILLEGINDIIHHPPASTEDIINGIKEIIEQCHRRNLNIYGATITPFKGHAKYSPEGEKTRQDVNHWIRTNANFKGVIDFDKIVRDPNDPCRMLSEYHSGDFLHPTDAGLKSMANSIDLSMFSEAAD